MRNVARKFEIAACFVLSACGPALSSTQIKTSSDTNILSKRDDGEVYYLPRAVLVARLIASPARGLRVVIDQPEIVADTQKVLVTPLPAAPGCAAASNIAVSGPFMLSHRISGFHKDTITIETERSLLKSIGADTEEQTTEALANLAKSVAAFTAESAMDPEEEELIAVRFDPADCGEVAAVQMAIRDGIDRLGVPRLRMMAAAGRAGSALAKLSLTAPQPSDFTLSLSGFSPFRRNGLAKCEVGVCVPVQVPASLVVSMAGRRRESPILHLPNKSDPVAIPVSRSGFADVKTTLTLDRGILTKREVVRTSEVAAILLLPATLVSAYLDELSSVFKKRKIAVDDEIALKKAQEDAKEKAEAAELSPETALLEVPVPELSVGGATKPIVTQAALPQGQAQSEKISGQPARETSQGDGQAVPKVNPPGTPKKQDLGKAGIGTNDAVRKTEGADGH